MSERLQGTIAGIEVITLKQDGTRCKRPYKKIKVENGTYSYFEGAKVNIGDTITYVLDDDSDGRYPPKMKTIIVQPKGAGAATPPQVPEPDPHMAKVDYVALRALLEEKLGTDEIVDKRVKQKMLDLKGLINADAALVLVAKELNVVTPLMDTRTIHTPAEGKSGSETTTITTTTYPDKPADKPTITRLCYLDTSAHATVAEVGKSSVTAITKDPYDILVIRADGERRKVNSKAWLWYDEHDEPAGAST